MAVRGPIDLAFMGSGNAFAPERCWSGFVLNERHLFDAPPTALYSLKRLHLRLDRIETVFISHFHADHFFGLPFLLLEYAYLTRRNNDLTLVGPPKLEQQLSKLVEIGYPSLLNAEAGYRLRYVEVEDGAHGTVNDLEYDAIEVEHGGEEMTSFGFRVNQAGRSLAYTGDTTYCDQLVRLAQGADVLVSDCTYPSGLKNPEHMSLDEVQLLHARIGGETQFVLTHLSGDIPSDLPRIAVASDLARFSF